MIHVSIKPTSRCNLNCLYCNLQEKSKATLSIVTVKDFLSWLVKNFPRERINVRWGGGEPLLTGFDLFNFAVEWQKRLSPNFENEISTNLTLLDENFLRLFKENDFAIFTSLDGIGHSHNFQRDGSFDIVIKALKNLKEYGISKVFVNTVVTKFNCNSLEEIYDLCESLKLKWNFTVVVPSGIQKVQAEKLLVNPVDFSNTIIKIFDKWFMSESPTEILIFYDIIRYIMGRDNCVPKNDPQFSLGFDGNLYACRLLVGNPMYSLGKFTGQNYIEQPSCYTCSYQRNDFYHFYQCKNCYFDFLCNFNHCAYLYEVYFDVPDISNYLCNCWKPIYAHIIECIRAETLFNYQHSKGGKNNERREKINIIKSRANFRRH